MAKNYSQKSGSYENNSKENVFKRAKGWAVGASVGLAALLGGGEAGGDIVDLVSFSQIVSDNNPPMDPMISNNGDFTINGGQTPQELASVGLIKDVTGGVTVVGYADNVDLGGWRSCLYGELHGNNHTTDPSADIYNLVVGEKVSRLWLLYDKDGNGRFGTLDDATGQFSIDTDELITDPLAFTINGETPGHDNLPTFYPSQSPNLSSVDVIISESNPASLLGLGAVGLALLSLRKGKKDLEEKLYL